MTDRYVFYTNTKMPLQSFTTFGINSKPNSTNPIGYFGTGLKNAVAIILRHGGTLTLTVDGTQHEFYSAPLEFRGKSFSQVRMRKKIWTPEGWRNIRSVAMPYTTELGKNWSLWQAYRELESNTRDEGGASGEYIQVDAPGTYIEVYCPGFVEITKKKNEVFLDVPGDKIFENSSFRMFDVGSRYIYYRGVRVYDLRYPARFTYDFKDRVVYLTEERTASNAYWLFHLISQALMTQIDARSVLNKALRVDKSAEHFEGHDLSFDASEEASTIFKEVARQLAVKGFAAPRAIGYHAALSYRSSSSRKLEVELTQDQWNEICAALKGAGKHDLAALISSQVGGAQTPPDTGDDMPF